MILERLSLFKEKLNQLEKRNLCLPVQYRLDTINNLRVKLILESIEIKIIEEQPYNFSATVYITDDIERDIVFKCYLEFDQLNLMLESIDNTVDCILPTVINWIKDYSEASYLDEDGKMDLLEEDCVSIEEDIIEQIAMVFWSVGGKNTYEII